MDFIEVGFELLQDSITADELCSSAKAQKPTEELVAHCKLCGHYEVAVAILNILDNSVISAKAVNDRIQKRIDKAYLYKLLFTAEHGENALSVCAHINLFELCIAFAVFAGALYIPHTVNAVGHNLVAAVGKQIVIALVDEQLEGADSVAVAVAALYLIVNIINGVFEVLKAYLLRCVTFALKLCAHGFVYLGNVVEGAFVAGFDSADVVGVGGDFLCLMLADKLVYHIGKAVSLSLIDELGGIDALSKEPYIVQVIAPVLDIVALFALRALEHNELDAVINIGVKNFPCLFERATLFAHDVYEVDFLNVSVDASALSVDAVLCKQLANVLGVEYVVFIRLPEKVLEH